MRPRSPSIALAGLGPLGVAFPVFPDGLRGLVSGLVRVVHGPVVVVGRRPLSRVLPLVAAVLGLLVVVVAGVVVVVVDGDDVRRFAERILSACNKDGSETCFYFLI
jgi:hypothetical protein